MDKKGAKKELELMVNGECWVHMKPDIDEYVYDVNDLQEWIDEADNQKYFMEDLSEIDIDKCKIIFYGVNNYDDEDQDKSAFMFLEKKKVIAIGYTGD